MLSGRLFQFQRSIFERSGSRPRFCDFVKTGNTVFAMKKVQADTEWSTLADLVGQVNELKATLPLDSTAKICNCKVLQVSSPQSNQELVCSDSNELGQLRPTHRLCATDPPAVSLQSGPKSDQMCVCDTGTSTVTTALNKEKLTTKNDKKWRHWQKLKINR